MKKIIFLLGVILLGGCDYNTSIGISPEGNTPFDFITHFEYKNHQYIKFRTSNSGSAIGGVVHDPDCKYCNKK